MDITGNPVERPGNEAELGRLTRRRLPTNIVQGRRSLVAKLFRRPGESEAIDVEGLEEDQGVLGTLGGRSRGNGRRDRRGHRARH